LCWKTRAQQIVVEGGGARGRQHHLSAERWRQIDPTDLVRNNRSRTMAFGRNFVFSRFLKDFYKIAAVGCR
jgi:hypothetical protein